MKKSNGLLIAGMIAMTAIPTWTVAHAGNDGGQGGVVYDHVGPDGRVLTEQEILDLLARSGQSTSSIDPNAVEVDYRGAASDVAAETKLCCENVEEVVTEQTDVQETTVGVDAVTEREIIQPVERTLIQPVERQILQPRVETITEDTVFEEEVLPVRVEADPVPPVSEVVIPQETVETREEVSERVVDAVVQRDIIQPIVRTTVVPVTRRVVRPQVESVTSETRYETRTAPLQVIEAPIPQTNEFVTEQVNEVVREQVTDRAVDYVSRRDVIQPVQRTIVQPVERRVLQGRTETVTAPTQYTEERLPVRIQDAGVPQVQENIIPQYIDKTVLEVQDVYVDQVTRNITQPVVITTVQPVERRVINPRRETVTAPVRYEESILPGRVLDVAIPQTQVNYIPQVSEQVREDYRETVFEAVTQREIIQPIVRTVVQPVEIVRINGRVETVTAPTQYETIRGNGVVMNVGGECVCQPVQYVPYR